MVEPWSDAGSGHEGDDTAPDLPTPVSDGKYLFVVDDGGFVSCVNIYNGEVIWGPQRTARGTVNASPLLAAGRLYLTNESAVTTVLEAGPEFKIVATNRLEDDYTLSSLATSRGLIFVRTSAHLYCSGKTER